MSLESLTPSKVVDEMEKQIPDLKPFRRYLEELIVFFRTAKIVHTPIRLVKSVGWSDTPIPLQEEMGGYVAVYSSMLTDGKTKFHHRGGEEEGLGISKGLRDDRPFLIRKTNGVEELNIDTYTTFGELLRKGNFRSSQFDVLRGTILDAARTNLVKCARDMDDADFTEKARATWTAKRKRINSDKGRRSAVNKLGKALASKEGFSKISAETILSAIQISLVDSTLLDRLATYSRSNSLDQDHWSVEMVEEALGVAATIWVNKE